MRGKESAQISANPDWINQILLHTKRMIQSNAISSKCKDFMIELSKYAFHLLSHACQGSLTSGLLWLSLGTPFIKVESANRCGDFVVKDWHNLPTKLVLNKQDLNYSCFLKRLKEACRTVRCSAYLKAFFQENPIGQFFHGHSHLVLKAIDCTVPMAASTRSNRLWKLSRPKHADEGDVVHNAQE